MKKVFAVLAIAAAFAACNNAAETTEAAIDSTANAATDSINATADSAIATVDSTANAAVDSLKAAADSIKK